mmetsp:Transcript_3781/g.7573  ORF Transcript_3781/g.7573 Transcript_3781/m.7573 type:complete len:209 (+) Transcript_3781:364-990(+)
MSSPKIRKMSSPKTTKKMKVRIAVVSKKSAKTYFLSWEVTVPFKNIAKFWMPTLPKLILPVRVILTLGGVKSPPPKHAFTCHRLVCSGYFFPLPTRKKALILRWTFAMHSVSPLNTTLSIQWDKRKLSPSPEVDPEVTPRRVSMFPAISPIQKVTFARNVKRPRSTVYLVHPVRIAPTTLWAPIRPSSVITSSLTLSKHVKTMMTKSS